MQFDAMICNFYHLKIIAMLINSAYIKAILLACAKKDVRYYLNGILINEKHIVGTNGHRLHAISHGGDWQHGPVILPREACEIALKGKTKELEVTNSSIGVVSYTPVQGTYPDYLRVMPNMSVPLDIGAMCCAARPEYLKDAAEAIRLVTGDAHAALASINGSYVWCDGRLMVLVMPIRDTSTVVRKMIQTSPLQ